MKINGLWGLFVVVAVSCAPSVQEVDEPSEPLKVPTSLFCQETCTEYKLKANGSERPVLFSCSEKDNRRKHPCRILYEVTCPETDGSDVCNQCPNSSDISETKDCKVPRAEKKDSRGPVNYDPLERELR